MSTLVQTPLGPFHVYDRGTITRGLQAGEWWDDHLKPILDMADPGVAIDIGAHFGWFTRYLAQNHSRVIACEPWPPSFELLTQNTRWTTGLEHRIQAWPIAAYDCVARLGFRYTNDVSDEGSFGFLPNAIHANPEMYVPAAPLDHYLLPSDHVTVIKCDAQGADLKALKGLQRTIGMWHPLIVFEREEGMLIEQGDTWEDYLSFFAGLGYTVDRITEDYWDYVARPK